MKSYFTLFFSYFSKINGTTIALGTIAAVSIFMIGLSVFRNGSLLPNSNTLNLTSYIFHDRSNLEEDLKDILTCIPLEDVTRIIHSYAAYDKQISETVKFINDMKTYISREFKKLPNTQFFINVLSQNGLQVQSWQNRMLDFWKDMPAYANDDPHASYGGLTMMISSILDRIQKEQLHALLLYKRDHSKSFRRFLRLLTSPEFIEFCQAIEKSREMQRLFYWAKEADIEIIFAVELLTCLYSYLTIELQQSTLVR